MPIPRRTPLITLMRLEAKHVASLNTILMSAVKDLDAKIAGMGSENPITLMQAKAQRAAMNDFLENTFDSMEDVTRRGMVEAAEAASRVVSQYENELLKMVLDKDAMSALAASEANRAAAGLEAALKRMQGTSYKPLSSTVYGTKNLASGWVDDTINRGLASGWSRQRLAAELRKSIDPRVPGGVSYAANRTARTEINNAFHASSAERYMNSVIVEGVDWNLSSSHPEGDICDTLADESPYPKKSVPQKPHPNCYCFITPALPTDEEFLEKLFNGDYDDESEWAEDYDSMSPAKLKVLLNEQTAKVFDIKRRLGIDGEELYSHPDYSQANNLRIAIRNAETRALQKSLAEKQAAKVAAKGAKAAPAKRVPKIAADAKKATTARPKVSVAKPRATMPRGVDVDGDIDLRNKYGRGFKIEKVLSDDTANGSVFQIRFADGTMGVMKKSSALDTQNELLAAQAYQRLGVKVPKSTRVMYEGEEYNVFEYIDGSAPWDAAERLGFGDVDDMISGMIGQNKGLEEMVRADYILGNSDRHMGNWLVNRDGSISGIDHGLTLNNSVGMDVQDTSAAFFQAGRIDRVADLAKGWNYAETRDAMASLRPMFEEMGRLGDWEEVMRRVDMLDNAFKNGTLEGLR